MHRFTDSQTLFETCSWLVGLILLEVIDSDQIIGVTSLYAIRVEELFSNWGVSHIGSLTLLVHIHCIVECSQQTVGREKPAQVFVDEALVCLSWFRCQLLFNLVDVSQRDQKVKLDLNLLELIFYFGKIDVICLEQEAFAECEHLVDSCYNVVFRTAI